MNKCGECKWLCGNESTVGIACLHPDRPFYLLASDVAKFKYKSTRACKRFEKKEVKDDRRRETPGHDDQEVS